MRDYNSIMRMQGHFICTRAGRGIFNRAHIAGHIGAFWGIIGGSNTDTLTGRSKTCSVSPPDR